MCTGSNIVNLFPDLKLVRFHLPLKKKESFFPGPDRGSRETRTVPVRCALHLLAPLGKPQQWRLVCGGCATAQALGRRPIWRRPGPLPPRRCPRSFGSWGATQGGPDLAHRDGPPLGCLCARGWWRTGTRVVDHHEPWGRSVLGRLLTGLWDASSGDSSARI